MPLEAVAKANWIKQKMTENEGLSTYLLRTAIGVVILTCAAWAGYVTTTNSTLRSDVSTLQQAVSGMNGKLDMILYELRHKEKDN